MRCHRRNGNLDVQWDSFLLETIFGEVHLGSCILANFLTSSSTCRTPFGELRKGFSEKGYEVVWDIAALGDCIFMQLLETETDACSTSDLNCLFHTHEYPSLVSRRNKTRTHHGVLACIPVYTLGPAVMFSTYWRQAQIR